MSVHEDRALLARALDVLAGSGDGATQVAEILALLARVVGARRAALVTDRPVRRGPGGRGSRRGPGRRARPRRVAGCRWFATGGGPGRLRARPRSSWSGRVAAGRRPRRARRGDARRPDGPLEVPGSTCGLGLEVWRASAARERPPPAPGTRRCATSWPLSPRRAPGRPTRPSAASSTPGSASASVSWRWSPTSCGPPSPGSAATWTCSPTGRSTTPGSGASSSSAAAASWSGWRRWWATCWS